MVLAGRSLLSVPKMEKCTFQGGMYFVQEDPNLTLAAVNHDPGSYNV